MKISIITPSLNSGKFIRQCIESVQNQTNVEVEHIVQDAGSTDDTVNIVRAYPSVQFYVEPDLGMSDGINKGALKATGDWWMWLNADDYLMLGSLKVASDWINQNPTADVLYGDFTYVDANSNPIRVAKHFPFDLRMMIHYGCYIGSTATFFKRSATIGNNLLLDILFKQVMDQEYYARLGKTGLKFQHIKAAPLASFRLHDDNTSMRHSNATDMAGIFKRQMQIAEGAAVRRKYGFSPSKTNPFINGISDAFLWYYFRLKKVFVKLIKGCYTKSR